MKTEFFFQDHDVRTRKKIKMPSYLFSKCQWPDQIQIRLDSVKYTCHIPICKINSYISGVVETFWSLSSSTIDMSNSKLTYLFLRYFGSSDGSKHGFVMVNLPLNISILVFFEGQNMPGHP